MTGLLEEALALWHEQPSSPPRFPKTFDSAGQAVRESALQRFLESLNAELRRIPRTRAERSAVHARITAAFVLFARTGLDLQDPHLDLLLNGGFAAIGTALARQARRFDPSVNTADILQASRNAWTACGLQVLFGRRMSLSPAIFAYSMLYPYTDNYLDNPAVSQDAKLGFGERFGRRLAGEDVSPCNSRESLIWRLVERIEEQYSRSEWPAVFESLAAIHSAQQKSLRLLRQDLGLAAEDVLRLSFEKGGASVLADAWLAAGSLSSGQARFAFQWGVALQLADDLQDLRHDRATGTITLFSRAAGCELLDALTNRALQFAAAATDEVRSLPGPDCAALKDLIASSSQSLFVRSAGEAGEFYSAEYLAELETHSPCRFEFLNLQREKLARKSGALTQLFEAFLEADDDEPAFPLLPSSLMPRL